MNIRPVEATVQSLRVNPIHHKWELMFKDTDGHYLPVYQEEYQADLIRKEMIKPGSVEEGEITIDGIDFKIDKLKSVIVNDLKEGILNTRLTVIQNNEQLKLNYPAEKAIVLALRKGAPILMDEKNIKNKSNKG